MSDETDQKEAYARALLRQPDDAYKAALAVFPGDIPKALHVSKTWPQDEDVQAFAQAALDEDGEDEFLPSKAQLARDVYDLAKHEKWVDPKDRIAAYKLYADLRGFIEKPGTTVNNNTLVDRRSVMVVTDHGTDEEWEAKLRAQQAALTHDATRPTVN